MTTDREDLREEDPEELQATNTTAAPKVPTPRMITLYHAGLRLAAMGSSE